MLGDSIRFRSSEIGYAYNQGGDATLICFHGYGESKEAFYFLEPHLQGRYGMLCIDLPFHGATIWNEGTDFSVDNLLEIISMICARHFSSNESLCLLGYSMGGRIALSLLPALSQQAKKVVLIAPDGLKLNFWYWLSTQTFVGNRLFAFTMHHPGWFFALLKVGNALGLANRSIVKFTRYYIHDNKVRGELYDRWTCMRKFRPPLPFARKLIIENKIPLHLVYGRHDRIIRFERGEKFRRGIEPFCFIDILDCGHQVLQQKNAAAISNLLQS